MNRRIRIAVSLFACTVLLGGCAKPPGGGIPHDALDSAIGAAIGDPSTCVILAERVGGKRVYQYGEDFNCTRPLAACDRPGTLTGKGALALADTPEGREASCPSNPAATRSVGWAEGRVVSTRRDLVFSAVMEGDRALPGREIAARLADAFSQAGL
ncbi:MAG TPA: hypothetical protein VII73_12665 [Caulobacteraceae bacterium]